MLVVATVLSLLALGVTRSPAVGATRSCGSSATSTRFARSSPSRSEQGADLDAIRENASDLGRPGTRARLDQVVRQTKSTLDELKQIDAPKAAEEAHSLLVATLQLRVLGRRDRWPRT